MCTYRHIHTIANLAYKEQRVGPRSKSKRCYIVLINPRGKELPLEHPVLCLAHKLCPINI